MALNFSGTSQFLSQPIAVATTYPMTLSAWCYMPGNPASNCYVLSISDATSANEYGLYVTPSGQVGCNVVSASTGSSFNTTATLSANTWFHACAVFSSPTSRVAYINGANPITSTVSNAPGIVNSTIIGSKTSAGLSVFAGAIAFPQVWNLDLSPTDVANLFAGTAVPESIESQNLVSYAWLIGQNPEPDFVLPTSWTITGSPNYAANPSIVFDSPAPVEEDDVPIDVTVSMDYVIGDGFTDSDLVDDPNLPVALPDFMIFGASPDAAIPAVMINEYNRVFDQMTYQYRV